jgi:hypothetical protein
VLLITGPRPRRSASRRAVAGLVGPAVRFVKPTPSVRFVSKEWQARQVTRAPALTSVAFSALTWLGVLSNYVWTATWPRDLAILVVACVAIACAIFAVIRGARSLLAWLAFAVCLIFPVWLWQVIVGLGWRRLLTRTFKSRRPVKESSSRAAERRSRKSIFLSSAGSAAARALGPQPRSISGCNASRAGRP